MFSRNLTWTSAGGNETFASQLSRKRFVPAIVAGVLVAIGIIGVGAWLIGSIGPSGAVTPELPANVGVAGDNREEPSTSHPVVELSAEKLAAAGIKTTTASVQNIHASEDVPGRLDYDANRHLEMLAPVDVVVRDVLVEPGQTVTAGERLAVLTSEAVGMARAEIRNREAEVAVAEQEYQWNKQITANLLELVAALDEDPDFAKVQDSFRSRPLGEYRDSLLSAYSKKKLAESINANMQPLADSGVLSGRSVQQRQSDLQIANAAYQSAKERSAFESSQELKRAKSAAEHSQRLLSISRQHLKAMLGPHADVVGGSDAESSDFVVHAPFAGRIEQRFIVASKRVAATQPMLAIADTSVLWVKAAVRERQWAALDSVEEQILHVRLPAIPNDSFTATVCFVGSTVSPETRSLPLVAEIDNSGQKFKPGMFVWVSVPTELPRQATVLPPAAIMRHEGKAFVFLRESPGRFRRIDVTVGLETPAFVEILTGVEPGTTVVSDGAFVLKSELLLEGEAE